MGPHPQFFGQLCSVVCFAQLLIFSTSHAQEIPKDTDEPQSKCSLTLIAEDGIHLSTRLQFSDDKFEYIEFQSKNGFVVGPGQVIVGTKNRPIRHYVTMPVSDANLKAARDQLVRQFSEKQYRLNNSNCIVFGVLLAKECGFPLDAGLEVGKTASQVVAMFAERYPQDVIYDVRPFPWITSSTPEKADLLQIELQSISCDKTESVFGSDRIYVVAYVQGRVVYQSDDRISINDDETKNLNEAIVTVPVGTPVSIQLWDDDRVDDDDLVFEQTLKPTQAEVKTLQQARGDIKFASRSKYSIALKTMRSE